MWCGGAIKNNLACVAYAEECDYQSRKEIAIEKLADEMLNNLADDDFNEISEKIRISLGFESISFDGLTKALKSICYEEAEYQVNNASKY